MNQQPRSRCFRQYLHHFALNCFLHLCGGTLTFLDFPIDLNLLTANWDSSRRTCLHSHFEGKMHKCCLVVSNSVTTRTVAPQALLSMDSSRQKYWSELPFPTSEDLPDPGIKPQSPTAPALPQANFSTPLLLRSPSDIWKEKKYD